LRRSCRLVNVDSAFWRARSVAGNQRKHDEALRLFAAISPGKKLGNSVDMVRSKPVINPAMKRLLIGSPFVFLSTALLAQTDSPTPEVSGAAVAGILGGVCVFYLILIAIWLFIAIWIMRDAKKRNSPNKTLVTVLGWI